MVKLLADAFRSFLSVIFIVSIGFPLLLNTCLAEDTLAYFNNPAQNAKVGEWIEYEKEVGGRKGDVYQIRIININDTPEPDEKTFNVVDIAINPREGRESRPRFISNLSDFERFLSDYKRFRIISWIPGGISHAVLEVAQQCDLTVSYGEESIQIKSKTYNTKTITMKPNPSMGTIPISLKFYLSQDIPASGLIRFELNAMPYSDNVYFTMQNYGWE